jgi:hypothetical protein
MVSSFMTGVTLVALGGGTGAVVGAVDCIF